MRRLRRILTTLFAVAAVLALLAWAVFQLPAFGGRASGARLARMEASPQFIGGRFENTPPQNTDTALLKTVRLYRQGFVRTPTFAIPVVPVAPARLQQPPPLGVRAFWFGHATALVEIDGVRILTDPVLSDRVSPVPIGPTRFHAPPILLAALTGIDAVVISHDHYDHLDMPTVRHLAGAGHALLRRTRRRRASGTVGGPGGADPRDGLVGHGGDPRRRHHLHAVTALLGTSGHGQLDAVEFVAAAGP